MKERKRERMCVCVCVRERERERVYFVLFKRGVFGPCMCVLEGEKS